MPAKRYPVLLDRATRVSHPLIIDSARKLTRARILLKADKSAAHKQIREALEVFY